MPERRTTLAAAGPGVEGACLFSGSAGIPMHCALSSHWTQVACGGSFLLVTWPPGKSVDYSSMPWVVETTPKGTLLHLLIDRVPCAALKPHFHFKRFPHSGETYTDPQPLLDVERNKETKNLPWNKT